jgi:hypothetical protein
MENNKEKYRNYYKMNVLPKGKKNIGESKYNIHIP